MTTLNASTDNNSGLEPALKDLLDKVLNYFEKFIKTKEELAVLENKLNDYESLTELVEITKDVFVSLTEIIDEKLAGGDDETYMELEKVVQKHEGEIRNHIRIEQQLKLYSESIQAKLDESEKTRTDMVEQTKTMINNLKRDNEKLNETVRKKTEEVEGLNTMMKSLEDANKDYKEKLQQLPFLQERISNLERQGKANSLKPVHFLKDNSHHSHDTENAKKLEMDVDYSKLHAKPDSARKSVKGVNTHQYASPLKFINKTLSGAVAAQNTKNVSNNNKEFVKIKVDVSDNKHKKELDALKNSYQKFYNPGKSQSKERERHSTSVNRTRELKSIYSIPLVTHSSNTSLVQTNQHLSHRDPMLSKLHQRSSSHCARNRSRASFAKIDDNL